MKILSTILLSLLLSSFSGPAQVYAQEADLARAIHRVKTGASGHISWWECGSRLSEEDTSIRAAEYASWLFAEHDADPDFDPWIGAAMAMQESSLNRCAISRDARRVFEDYLGRRPTETETVHFLASSAYRRRVGVLRAFDAGLVQFRWPGVVATMVGVRDPRTLVDARTSIRMLAASLSHYREACSSVSSYSGTHSVNRDDGTTRVIRYDIPCEDGYWVQHNSPRRFNYSYYSNVMRWNTAFRSSLEAETDEEDPS